MDFEEKDEVVRLRLPSSMKKKLQLLAKRKGLNVSQVMRNYIGTLINEDENRNILAARDNYLELPKEDKNPYGETVTIRVPSELKALYNKCCTSNSLKAGELLRNFIRDYTEFKLLLYSDPLRPLSGYIKYLLMFLRIAEYNKGNAFESCRMVWSKTKITDDKPIIEQVDDSLYCVNDMQAQCRYIIQFVDLNDIDVATSPFD